MTDDINIVIRRLYVICSSNVNSHLTHTTLKVHLIRDLLDNCVWNLLAILTTDFIDNDDENEASVGGITLLSSKSTPDASTIALPATICIRYV
jgi:hypothetical protein